MSHKTKQRFFSFIILVVAVAILVLLWPKKSIAPEASKIGGEVAKSAVATVAQIQSVETNENVQVAVLMYHHIGPLPDKADTIRKGLTISPEEFENQLKYFKENGYTITTFEKFDEMVLAKSVPQKLIILTFDDGYDDNFTYAFDLMKKYNVTGTFFIITSKIGKKEYMSEEQIKELSKSGNEIGSHTVNHPSLENYKGESLKNELAKSKETLESLISKKVISFCYPAGKFNDETVRAVSETGYKYAVTTQSSTGVINLKDLLKIPRFRISAGRNIEVLLK